MGRIVQIICGCILAASLFSSAEARQPSGARPELARDTSGQLLRTNVERAAEVEAERAVAADQRDQDDLKAQERMAIAAEAQAVDVERQTLWFGLSVILTAIASIVSVSALWVAIGTGRRELRAYMMVETISVHTPSGDPKYARKRNRLPDYPWVRIGIKNFGPTPALNVLHFAEIRVLPSADEDALELPSKMVQISEGATAPGGLLWKSISLARTLTQEEAAKITTGEWALFVYGRVTYRDVFRRPRETRFRLKHCGAWPPLAGHDLYYCDRGNTAN